MPNKSFIVLWCFVVVLMETWDFCGSSWYFLKPCGNLWYFCGGFVVIESPL